MEIINIDFLIRTTAAAVSLEIIRKTAGVSYAQAYFIRPNLILFNAQKRIAGVPKSALQCFYHLVINYRTRAVRLKQL